MVFDSRDIRQMDVQAPPHGSLFRGNESCVRDLPHVKQNFESNPFIIIYHDEKSPETQRF